MSAPHETTEQGPRSWVKVTTALEQAMGPGRRAGAWTQYCCPVHENDGRRHRPSLITQHFDTDGKTEIKCLAGCSRDDILAAVELEVRDLYDRPARGRSRGPRRPGQAPAARPKSRADIAIEAAGVSVASHKPDLGRQRSAWRTVDTYEYVRADGTVAGVVRRRQARFEHGTTKSFSQQAWDPEAGRWRDSGFDKIPYRLPQVREAIGDGDRVIYICEGEKDVHAAESAGLTATTNVGGALSWTREHAEKLAGVHTVVIVVDHDAPGYRRAERVMESLVGIAQRVRVVGAATGKDLHDHLQVGHEIADLTPIPGLDPFTPITAAPAVEAGETTPTPGGPTAMPEYLLAPSGEAPAMHSDDVDHMHRNWTQVMQLVMARLMAGAAEAAERRRRSLEQIAENRRLSEEEQARQREAERHAAEIKLKKILDSDLRKAPRAVIERMVSDAAAWSAESDLAREALGKLAVHVQSRYGVRIDTETGEVSVAAHVAARPELGQALLAAEGEQADGSRLKMAQIRMVELISEQKSLPEETRAELLAEIEAWRSQPGTRQLEGLTKKLAAAKIPAPVRHRIRFIAAYLGHPGEIAPLSDSGTHEAAARATRELRRIPEQLVDPGEEAKAHIDALLVRYQDAQMIGGPTDSLRERLAHEVALLNPEDQAKARARGIEIRDNPAKEQKPLWPQHVDRTELGTQVHTYAQLARRAEALQAAAGALEGTADDGVLKRAAEARKKIVDAIAHGENLHPLEKDQLRAVLTDINAGKNSVPDLMFVDDKSAAALDRARADTHAQSTSRVTRRQIEQALESSGAPVGTVRRAREQITAVMDAQMHLASGRISLPEYEETGRMERLDAQLQGLGVNEAVRNRVQGLLSRAREESAIDGLQARRIADVWSEREDGVAKSRMPSRSQYSYTRHERVAQLKRGLEQDGLTADEVLQNVAALSGRAAPLAAAAAAGKKRASKGKDDDAPAQGMTSPAQRWQGRAADGPGHSR
ncbi:toprim domain-containing protein [Nocardia thailandica]|uniref:Toprim domain-containing protein n=1 Tax=Nocardia thailandica TaxID=257275 RepID=A0ABW6PWT3_9NOCA